MLDNLMPVKLCHTEELGWLFTDLTSLLLRIEKRWMASYLLAAKWASLPQIRKKTFWTRMKGRFCSYSSEISREPLSSNKFGISTDSFFFSLMLDKALIQGIISSYMAAAPQVRITVTLNWRSYQSSGAVELLLLGRKVSLRLTKNDALKTASAQYWLSSRPCDMSMLWFACTTTCIMTKICLGGFLLPTLSNPPMALSINRILTSKVFNVKKT